MFKRLSFQLSGLMVVVLMLSSVVMAQSFPDVNEAHQYRKAIEFLKNNDVVNGHDDGLFRPDSKVNRAEFLKMILEEAKIEVQSPTEDCFPDVPKDVWFGKYVCHAKLKGWVEGYPDGNFRPGQSVNKVEALKMMGEILGWDFSEYENTSLKRERFNDVDLSQWYGKYLAYAIDRELVDDPAGAFGPGVEMKRGQVAEYVYREVTVRVLDVEKYEEKHDEAIAEKGIPEEGLKEDGVEGDRVETGSTISEGEPEIKTAEEISEDEMEKFAAERSRIAEKVRDEIIATHPNKDELVAFMWSVPYQKGDTIGVYDLDRPDYENHTETLAGDTWLVFLDLAPQAMWHHPTEFILIDAGTDELKLRKEEGYPIINGVGWWSTDEMRRDTDFWIYPTDGNTDRLANMSPAFMAIKTNSSELLAAGSLEGLIAQTSGRSYREMYEEERKKEFETDEDEGEYEKARDADKKAPKVAADFQSPCKKDCTGVTPKKLALVISGFDTGDSFLPYQSRIRDALIKQGYETVYVGADVGEKLENTPDGQPKENFKYTTEANVKAAFSELAAKVSSCCDEVVIYISGHGSRGGGIAMNELTKHKKLIRDPKDKTKGKYVIDKITGHKDGGTIYTREWKTMLDKIKSCKTQVIINSCFSGKHIEKGLNKDVDQEGCLCRTVHISSVATRPTYAVNWTLEFEKAIAAGKSVSEGGFEAYKKVKDRGFYSNFPFASSTGTELCEDPDGDGLCTGTENAFGSDGSKADTDDDGLNDKEEYELKGTDKQTDPKNDDTDGDGLKDGKEVKELKTNPKKKDTDDDGVDDKAEGFATTDPLDPDSDDDGCNDGKELYEDHTDPKNKDSHGPSCGELKNGGTTSLKAGESHKIAGHTIKLIEEYEDNTNDNKKTYQITIDGEEINVVVGQKFVFGDYELEVKTVYPDGKVVIEVRPKS